MSEKDVVVRENDLPAIADDYLIHIAEQAERRIDAVIKIKKCALKVTNAHDWVDQQGKPYLQASGAEKIANLFNISWSFMTPEPLYEEDPDGHYTYTYTGKFTLGSRTIEVEGSRSSKDGFFSQYNYPEQGPRTEKNIADRDNKRDVKMAALTNLFGNGITRILGIRNLTYADLLEFAGIKQEDIGKVEYKKKGETKPPIQPPQPKSETTNETITAVVEKVEKSPKSEAIFIIAGDNKFSTFDKKLAEATKALIGQQAELVYTTSGKYKNLTGISRATEDPKCTKDPASCDRSTFDEQDKAVCDYEPLDPTAAKPCKFQVSKEEKLL